MNKYILLVAILAGLLAFAAPASSDPPQPIAVPAGDLIAALESISRQSRIELLFDRNLLKGARTRGVSGTYTSEQAIRKLLEGTKFELSTDEATGAMMIGEVQPSRSSARVDGAGSMKLAQAEQTANTQASAENKTQEEVVVIGTNIRGVYPSSYPVEIYTAEDIARTGATTTEQFIQKLPQNFGTRTQYSPGSNTGVGAQNFDAVASIDLRGLGVGTSLTLLNGRRLGLADAGRSADVSLIPAGAIARVEVLTDGASAIYGSDAIGGVVNFVLRDDFDGAQTRLSYGGVTDGGLRQGEASQTFGRGWGSGRGLVSYTYYSASPLEREDRAFAAAAGPGFLTPDDTRHNVFLTLSQDAGERLKLGGDFGFARRKVAEEYFSSFPGFPSNDSFNRYRSDTDQWFANLALDYEVAGAANASLQASYARSDVDGVAVSTLVNSAQQTTIVLPVQTDYSLLDLTAKLDGSLFDLRGGAVRFSVGAGVLDEDYSGATGSGFPVGRDLGRQTGYAFAELFAPLIGKEQGVRLVHRLELSLAGRYTRYDDTSSPSVGQEFGDATDPKIGLLWSPFEGLNFRTTYGTSFRAPTLTETDPTGATSSLFLNRVIAGVPRSEVTVGGAAVNLRPETAQTYTAGFDFRPHARPAFRLSATYYGIEYEDRIASAPSGGDVRVNPLNYPDAIYPATSAAMLQEILGQSTYHATIRAALPGVDFSNPQAVAAGLFALPNPWIFDRRLKNLALSKQAGFDLSIGEGFETSIGAIDMGLTVARIFSYEQQASGISPTVSVVDDVYRPSNLRGRFHASFSRAGFNGTFGVNHVDSYRNRVRNVDVESWTTADLSLSYAFEKASGAVLGGVRLNLSVQNLFDEDPPFVSAVSVTQEIGFDAANANPLGRLVVFGLTKTW